jgi:hypothetical protein
VRRRLVRLLGGGLLLGLVAWLARQIGYAAGYASGMFEGSSSLIDGILGKHTPRPGGGS